MVGLTVGPASIHKAPDDFVPSHKPSDAPIQEVGYTTIAGNGIAHATGLPGCIANELLALEDGTLGLASNLDVHGIGAAILGDFVGVEGGQEIRRTGEVLFMPVGNGYLGCVVNPLGRPFDGPDEIQGVEGRRILETQAPDVMHRHPADEPLSTGLRTTDAVTPIGHGQYQLIVNDRRTGKTVITIDAITNQRANWESGNPKKQVRCVYVVIGQKGFTTTSMKQSLESAGTMEYTTIVASPAAGSADLEYITPYTNPTIGQHWMHNDKYALITFDDLSKQTGVYRPISPLLHHPLGHGTYPDDMPYLHSHLFERCIKVSDGLDGGSMTSLLAVKTKADDASAYIPTDMTSITDGQTFLQSSLFNANQRPVIDVGASVSQVGDATQAEALKKVSGTLKISLTQYCSLESFAVFASDLNMASKAQLIRDAHLTELLKQPQLCPYPPKQEAVSVWTGIHGKLDDPNLKDIPPFEQGLLDYIDHNTDVLKTIRRTEGSAADAETALNKVVGEFCSTPVSFIDEPLVEKKPSVNKAAPADQEKIATGEK